MVNHNHHPLPGFLKVLIPKGFKFFRKNTCRSVDSRRVMEGLKLYKSNCFGPEGNGGDGASGDVRTVGGVKFMRNSSIKR